MRQGLVYRLTAEALGTAIVVFFGASALLTAGTLLLSAAIAFFVAIAAATWIFGGHFNPSITLAQALRGRLSWFDAAACVAAQLIGGLVGGLLVWATYGDAGVDARLGATRLADQVDSGNGLISALVAEAVATAVLVLVFLALTDPVPTGWGTGTGRSGERAAERAAERATGLGTGLAGGIGTGLAYAGGVLAIGALTGGSMNFARTLGPDLTLALADGSTAWSDIWVYLVGPLVGAAVAAFAYNALASGTPRTSEP